MGYTEHLLSVLGEEEVGERINSFFPEVVNRIGLTAEQAAAYGEVRVRELPIHGSLEGKPFVASNDRITELWVGNRAVASILELRDEFNYANILFADYLSPDLIAALHEAISTTEQSQLLPPS
jgi:hypothetical protein